MQVPGWNAWEQKIYSIPISTENLKMWDYLIADNDIILQTSHGCLQSFLNVLKTFHNPPKNWVMTHWWVLTHSLGNTVLHYYTIAWGILLFCACFEEEYRLDSAHRSLILTYTEYLYCDLYYQPGVNEWHAFSACDLQETTIYLLCHFNSFPASIFLLQGVYSWPASDSWGCRLGF